MKILFLDITCPKPYSTQTLETEPLGGTEATVIRIADALEGEHEVTVAQHNRGKRDGKYIPLDDIGPADAVIALRTPKLIPFIRENYKGAKPFLWCHDFNQLELVQSYPVLKDTGLKILGVSRTHKTAIADALLTMVGQVSGLTADFIYNPIADDLAPDSTPVDLNKLVFFSSPHKGLERTLELFKILRNGHPNFNLYCANPGYLADGDCGVPGVHNLGALSHSEGLSHVRSSLLTLHANTVFPETFGLVYAESNAVGTPCLTHQIAGTADARHEVLGPKYGQILDTRNTEAVIERILHFQKERPAVSANPKFRLSAVVQRWKELLS